MTGAPPTVRASISSAVASRTSRTWMCMRSDMPAMPLDFAYAPTQFGPQGGLVIWLPDDYFVPPTKRQQKVKPTEDLLL